MKRGLVRAMMDRVMVVLKLREEKLHCLGILHMTDPKSKRKLAKPNFMVLQGEERIDNLPANLD